MQRKKSAGRPGCFQCAIGCHKPPKRAQKRQFWPIKNQTRRCVLTRLAQMDYVVSAASREPPAASAERSAVAGFGLGLVSKGRLPFASPWIGA
jgi:hypothetical protein